MSKTQKSDIGEPLLPGINTPADLRKLQVNQLPQLCREIRQFLIQELAVNPGHFASSMGAVELTVALHYVFDTPYDRLVWDVGHQAYVHKILTGRREKFSTNRKLGGISGFPNPEESEYDTFTAGHASNSISAALGMAVASRLQGDSPRRNVVAVIGDASISGGLAFEGINNAANMPDNLLIVLNDNDMSIDHNVGSLNSHLAHLTASKGYNDIRYKMYKGLKRMGLISDRHRGFILRFSNSLKSLLTRQQNIFEGLNIRYFGPFDGHDVKRIVRVLSDIRDMHGPRLLHLRTIKGKGYAPAEQDPTTWHAPGRFDPATGEREADKKPTSPQPRKYQDVFGDTLVELARVNDKIVGITAAMPSGTSMSIMQEVMPERVFDVGISEGHAVTFAGGLAKDGMRPYVAIYSSFLQRAYDHIIHDVAIQRLPVTFCIDRAGLVGEDGMTHHGALDMSYLRSVPNMIISSPRDEHYLRHLLYTAQDGGDHGPFAIRYPRGKGLLLEWQCPMHSLAIGRGECLRPGSDVAVISIGPVAYEAQKAAEKAQSAGVSVALYDAIFIKPFDTDMLQEITDAGMPIVTIEDGTLHGGLGSVVAEWLAEHGKAPHAATLRRLALPDKFVTQGTPQQLQRLCEIDADAIYQAIMQLHGETGHSGTTKEVVVSSNTPT